MQSPERSTSSSATAAASSPVPPSVMRLWRPAAQRNLRNQWSKLASLGKEWVSASSTGKSHAAALVNAFLSQKYMPSMQLGALSDMPDIRKKASSKLFKQQEHYRSKLLSSYRDMVVAVTEMVNISRCMRCYVKGTNSGSLVQFSSSCEDNNDSGDGGGIPVFAFWSIASFEMLAEELVRMFTSELNLKRMLVLELANISCEVAQLIKCCWSEELYQGEFDDLRICNLYSLETCEPVLPRVIEGKFNAPTVEVQNQPNSDNLLVYLTTWLAEVNIDTHRVEEIFSIIGEEMHVSLS